MSGKVSNTIDTMLITIGAMIGLSDIESLLGIIILCVQIVWIFVKIGIRIYDNVKNKNMNGVVDDIKDLHDELNNLKDDIDKKEDDDGK